MDALVLKHLRAEIENKADRQLVYLKVIYRLSEMYVFERNDCLEFNHDLSFHEKIHAADADDLFAVVNRHLFFAFIDKVMKGKFQFQRPLIDHFLKSVAQCGMYRDAGSNDTACDISIQHAHFPL